MTQLPSKRVCPKRCRLELPEPMSLTCCSSYKQPAAFSGTSTGSGRSHDGTKWLKEITVPFQPSATWRFSTRLTSWSFHRLKNLCAPSSPIGHLQNASYLALSGRGSDLQKVQLHHERSGTTNTPSMTSAGIISTPIFSHMSNRARSFSIESLKFRFIVSS